MSDGDETKSAADAGAAEQAGHDAHAIHMPSNSWTPISGALALGLIFVGLLGEIRSTIGPTMWVIGLVLLIVSLAVWARGARTEYKALPEDQQD